MESLSEEVWDVLIAGTSLPQSLLALALSRSQKKVLHVDHNSYYGGEDAGFGLQDARDWAERLRLHKSALFSNAVIEESEGSRTKDEPSLLGASRSYTLSLNPQIIYAQSRLLPTLVSSRIHSQLEFLAVGSWWVYRDGALQKIPSTREDVFNDESLSMRDKRSLMKFLRFVLQEDGHDSPVPDSLSDQTLANALKTKFKLSERLEAPVLALALSPTPAETISLENATTRIRRHMRSVGYFGPGFGAVIAKYGGNAELTQVACRAQAVGGGIYLLGHGVDTIVPSSEQQTNHKDADNTIKVKLSDGTEVRSRWVVGGSDDLLPYDPSDKALDGSLQVSTCHSIDIVSDPLQHLFPATSENGPVPAAVIVLVHDDAGADCSPIYLQVHSEDTGECPSGQCIIYGSFQSAKLDARDLLRAAVSNVIRNAPSGTNPRSLWAMSYTSHQPASYQLFTPDEAGHSLSRVVTLPTRPHDISLQDETLDNINALWKAVVGSEADRDDFLKFEDRGQEKDDEI